MHMTTTAAAAAAAAAEAAAAAALDERSGADLAEVEAYLRQLLPALAHAAGAAVPEPEEQQQHASSSSLEQLGLSRGALAAAGLPPHAISSLHRALAAHAGAFRKLVAGEVQQLRGLLVQQQGVSPAGQQLSGTIQLLGGPFVAAHAAPGSAAITAAAAALFAGKAPPPARAQQPPASQPAAPSGPERDGTDTDTAGSDTRAAAAVCAPGPAAVLGTSHKEAAGHHHDAAAGGPSASELARDYAEAYSSMKESLEIRLRHETRCREFLQGKVQQLETALNDAAAQQDAASRRAADQRAETDALAAEHAELQQALATSHAAHLALQQHHTGQMEAWKVERGSMEQQHKQQLEALQQELATTAAAAAAYTDANRQAEALRLLYNEELGRASRLAVKVSKATAAADRAAAQEAQWARQVASSDGRADNAEGLAAAMQLSARQLEAALAKQQQQLAAHQAEAEQLRVLLERSRFAAVAEAAAARARVGSLGSDLTHARSELASKSAALAAATDAARRQAMELEGANAQLRAGRSHMKQLMSDLEAEQEKTAGLTAALDESKAAATAAVSQAEVACARLTSTQEQLGRANEAAADMQEQLGQLEATVQEHAAAQEQAAAVSAALEAEAGILRERLSELVCVQQEVGELRVQHEAATARVSQLEAEHVDLADKAGQLLLVTAELQDLHGQHASLQDSMAALQQQLDAADKEIADIRAAGSTSASQLLELQEQLATADALREQLAAELAASTAGGQAARQQAAALAQQLERVQAALEAAEADRQTLAAQRDGWMASFQEAFGKLQEWTASSEAASRQMAARADALQGAVQQLSAEAQAGAKAGDTRAAASGAAAADATAPTAAAAAPAGRPAAASSTDVVDQLVALQQLVRGEAHKQLDGFNETLKALSQRVQERHEAAQSSWQQALAGSNARRAAGHAQARSRQSTSLAAAVQAAMMGAAASPAAARLPAVVDAETSKEAAAGGPADKPPAAECAQQQLVQPSGQLQDSGQAAADDAGGASSSSLEAPAAGASEDGNVLPSPAAPAAASAAAAAVTPPDSPSVSGPGGCLPADSLLDAATAVDGTATSGRLSAFVSLATYQAQMQSVARLHGQMGQMVVQLREAHADATGAQQLLQQERQEAASRTSAMREALGQLHGQLEELRQDHTQLQASHRTLMTKELLNSGLLRDRYVTNLFGRLQEALWKLDTARRRATTWGFELLVPLGRCDRGIQTQPGEIWAAAAAATGSSRSSNSTSKSAGHMQLDLSALAQPQSDVVLPPAGRQSPAFGERTGSASSGLRRTAGSPAATCARLPHISGVAGRSNGAFAEGSSRPASARSGAAAAAGALSSKVLPACVPSLLLPPGVADVAARIEAWPGMAALLSWVAHGAYLEGLQQQHLGRPLMDVQAPHVHLLLLEARDVLRLGSQSLLPRLHVVDAATPFARLLRIPAAAALVQEERQPGPVGCNSSCPPEPPSSAISVPLLVLSSAALQQLPALELQAAMAAALAPLALLLPQHHQQHEQQRTPDGCSPAAGAELHSGAPILADLATLASLLALAPVLLLARLPPEMHAMGASLAAALTAVDRLVAAAGDRAGLLACQDLPAALSALVRTAGAAGNASVQDWQQRVAAAEQEGRLPSMGDLVPAHGKLAASSSSRRQQQPDAQDAEVLDQAVLLMRVSQLLAFVQSREYAHALEAGSPLHRVLRPSSSSSSSSWLAA